MKQEGFLKRARILGEVRMLLVSWLLLVVPACAPRLKVEAERRSGPTRSPLAERIPDKFLSELAARAEKLGASDGKLAGLDSGRGGDSLARVITVDEKRCLLAYARATSEVRDLDLMILDEDGTILAESSSEDPEPTLLFCVERKTRAYASARIADGVGRFGLVYHDVDPFLARRLGSELKVQGGDYGAPVQLTWPRVEGILATRDTALGSRFADQRRVVVALDPMTPTRLPLLVREGRCVDAIVLGRGSHSRISFEILDDRERVLALAQTFGWGDSAFLCSPGAESQLALQLRIENEPDAALVVLRESTEPAERAMSLSQIVPMVVGALPAHASGESKRSLELRVGEIESVTLGEKGRKRGDSSSCAWVQLSPKAPLLGVSAQIWSEEGELLAETETSTPSRLFYCAAGPVRLDLSATERGGPLHYQEVSVDSSAHRERRADALATSRLLTMMAPYLSGNAPAIPRIIPVPLAEERLLKVPLLVTQGKCQTIFLAAGRGAAAVQLRVLNAASGKELDRHRGARAAQVRACGLASNEYLVEMRSLGGDAPAVWGSVLEGAPPE